MDQENGKQEEFRFFIWIKEKIVNRNVAVFSFFLLLSSFLWFLNNLSKEMTGRIEYPARYINLANNRALVNELPEKITLTVSGPGYSIIKSRLSGSLPPLPVDLSRVDHKVTRDDQRYEFYILTFNLREDFRRRLRDEYEVLTVDPDTIFFEFDRITKKKVPVIVSIEALPQKQHMIYGRITSSPDSVELTGPKAMIDTIFAVYTKFEKKSQLNKDTELSVQLEGIRKIAISQKRVDITIPVEQFTEAVREIPIKLINVRDDGDIRLFPDKVKVLCNVAMKDYQLFLDAPIEAFCDMSQVDILVTQKLKISLENVPAYVNMVRHNPQEVEYIFEKK